MPAVNQAKDTLEAVNRRINEASRYVADAEQFGELDRWEDITESDCGDCEDYAIGKARALIELGWPVADLRLAIVGVADPHGDHGVLCARDAAGQWWVLDNRHPYVMAPADLGYTWVMWGIGRTWTQVTLNE